MIAYKLEILVIDFDEIGQEQIKRVIENTKYSNWCISPKVKNIVAKDIGQWSDGHPMNHIDTEDAEYGRLFGSDNA